MDFINYINELHAVGYSYTQIAMELNISKELLCYRRDNFMNMKIKDYIELKNVYDRLIVEAHSK